MRRAATLALLLGAGCGLSSEGLSSSPTGTTSTETSAGGGGAGDGGSTTTTSASGGGGGGGGGTGGTGGSSPECGPGEDCITTAGGGKYVVVVDGASCPAGWDAVGPYASTNQDPGCTACSCGAPAGSCIPGDAYAFDGISGAVCAAPVQSFDNPSDGSCLDVDNSQTGKDAFGEYGPTPSGGTCAPSAVSPVPLVTQTVCTTAAQPTSCSTGSCVPTPATGAVCVLVPAVDACPPGWPTPKSAFSVQSDDRTCGCTCDPAPVGTCMGASVDAFTNATCFGAPTVTIPADGQCWDPASINNVGSMLVHAGTWTGSGACGVQVQNSGAVVFGPEMRVCCAQ